MDEKEEVKLFCKFNVMHLLIVVISPLIIGGIIALVTQDLLYLEVMYVLFGSIDLCLIPIRLRIRDGSNYKKNKSVVEDKTTNEFKGWLNYQYIIAISGGIDLLLSLLVFAIGQAL